MLKISLREYVCVDVISKCINSPYTMDLECHFHSLALSAWQSKFWLSRWFSTLHMRWVLSKRQKSCLSDCSPGYLNSGNYSEAFQLSKQN